MKQIISFLLGHKKFKLTANNNMKTFLCYSHQYKIQTYQKAANQKAMIQVKIKHLVTNIEIGCREADSFIKYLFDLNNAENRSWATSLGRISIFGIEKRKASSWPALRFGMGKAFVDSFPLSDSRASPSDLGKYYKRTKIIKVYFELSLL